MIIIIFGLMQQHLKVNLHLVLIGKLTVFNWRYKKNVFC